MCRKLSKRDSMCDIEYGSIEINFEPSIINLISHLFGCKSPKNAKQIFYYFDDSRHIYDNNDIKKSKSFNLFKNNKSPPIAIRNKMNLSVHNKIYSSFKTDKEIGNFKIFYDHPSYPIIKKSTFNCAYRIYDLGFEGNVNYTLGLSCIHQDINKERYIFAYNKKEFTKSQVLFLLHYILNTTGH